VFPRFMKAAKASAVFALGLMFFSTAAIAGHDNGHSQRYIPGVWVNPDGCEHWVMDDGWEGYMTPNVTRDGIPVFQRVKACLVESGDQLFAVDKHFINAANTKRLQDFFRSAGATAYSVYGHTDSDASDAYNMGLSARRANAVARIAASVGAPGTTTGKFKNVIFDPL
jgi:outer membrane protein OmpA-like peptidoglycan-associated protein